MNRASASQFPIPSTESSSNDYFSLSSGDPSSRTVKINDKQIAAPPLNYLQFSLGRQRAILIPRGRYLSSHRDFFPLTCRPRASPAAPK